MLKKIQSALIIVLAIFSSLAFAQSPTIKAGAQYQSLTKPVNDMPPVIEFFSFYCGPCYLFAEKYHVDSTISQTLPKDIKLTKYHVGMMGALGQELTTAWSIAAVLGLQDKVEPLLFDSKRAGTLNSVDDIRAIFATLGVSPERYEEMRQDKDVIAFVEKQNKAIAEFGVTDTPSFYVLGKYKVNNGGVNDKTIEGFPKELANIIVYLLDK